MNKTHEHLTPHIIEHKKKPRHVKLEIEVLVWDTIKNVTGSNRLIEFIPGHWIVNIVQSCYVHVEPGNQ